MTISSMYNVDAGLKWISPNGKAEISLKVDDMFNSWVPKDLNLQYKTQDLHMRMIPDSRRVSLSFIYKFGDFKAKEHKEVYNPQNEMFRLLGTKRSFSQNETFFFSHP